MKTMRSGAPANPFATRHYAPGRLRYRFFQDGTETLSAEAVARLYDTFMDTGRTGQLVGRKGTGKSTLLRMLHAEAVRHGHGARYVLLREDDPHLPDDWQAIPAGANPTAPRVLLLDGAEQLARMRFWWLRAQCRRAGRGLLITTHHDLGLPTLRQHAVDARTAVAVVREILDASPGLPELVRADEAAAALAASEGNLREAIFKMYDWYEQRWSARADT